MKLIRVYEMSWTTLNPTLNPKPYPYTLGLKPRGVEADGSQHKMSSKLLGAPIEKPTLVWNVSMDPKA